MRRPSPLHIVGLDAAAPEPAEVDREQIGLALVPLLVLAERRITDAQLDELDALCASLPEQPTWRQMVDFRIGYWTVVASATRNAIFELRVRSWFKAASVRDGGLRTLCMLTTSSDYRQLARALRARSGAMEYWLNVLEPLFGATETRLDQRACSEPGEAS